MEFLFECKIGYGVTAGILWLFGVCGIGYITPKARDGVKGWHFASK